MSPNSDSPLLSPGKLGEIIAAARSPISAAFLGRIQAEVPGIQGETRQYLENYLQSVLQASIDYLGADGRDEALLQTADLAKQHALQCAQSGRYTIQDLRQEYQVLRAVIFAELPAGTGLSLRASELFSQVFAASVSSATESFVRSAGAAQLEQQRRSEETRTAARREREAIAAIEVERANFANLFRQSPEMVCILSGPEHRFEFVNEAHVRALGFDATGKNVRAAQPESVEIHDILDNVYRTGKTAELHEIPVTVTDRLRYFNLTYAARRDAQGTIDGIMVLGTEVTEQVLFQKSNQLQQKALELALENAPLDQVLAVLAKMVELQSGSDLLASILLIDEEGRHLLHGAAPSLPAAYNEVIHGIEVAALVDSWGSPEYDPARVTVADIAQEPRWAAVKDHALAHGLRASWSVPILTAQGKLLGTFALYFRAGRMPTPHEHQIVDIAVRTTALILGRRREISARLANAEALREREAELYASKRMLELAASGGRIGFWHVNTARGTFDPDEKMAADWGIDLAQFPRTFAAGMAVVHPEDRWIISSGMASAFAGTEVYDKEFRIVLPSGEQRWMQSKGEFHADESGNRTLFSGVSIDVTERVRLRQETEKANSLLQSERHNLNEIFQSSPAAMATWLGPRFVFDRVNPEYAKIFGNRPLIGRELLEACPELRGQGFDDMLRRVLTTGEPHIGTEVLAQVAKFPGGPTEDRYYNFKYLRINDQDSNPYGVYDFAIDVTEQVLAQRRLRESGAKLREAEDLLKRAIEVANIGFYEWDLTSNRITFSAQMQKDWGIDGGTSLEGVVSHIHPEDRERVNHGIAKTVAAGTKYFEEYRVQRPTDGKIIWIEAQGGLVEDSQGKLTRFIGTSLDITRRKTTEEQLKAASIEARNASSAKSAFLANMSHEIRTPLGAIMGFAELLKKPDLTRSNSANFISVIERNSQHLLRIVDDILDLSKVEAGKMVFEHIEFSLPDLLSDFASLMGLRARDKGIDFVLKITSSIPALVISDPTRLRQILNNIVGNSIKFTDRGLVELSVSYEDKFLTIVVKDTGRGISPEQMDRLFQAFVQADETTTRKFGGTGLGLVLTKRLASAMGGDFYLRESTPGVGSVFVACIKIGIISGTRFVDDETLHFSTVEEEFAAPALSMLAGMKLLVVDDSPDNRTLLRVMLQDAGAAVESAKDGLQGVEMALAAPYDVVLMDIQMPRMDGYQAIEVLKGKGYAAPIVALTAHAMVEERERAKGKGFAAFMTKPIQRDSLLSLLDGLKRKNPPLPATAASARAVGSDERPAARKVLIVEDDPDTSEAMEIILGRLGLSIQCARAGKEVVAALGQGYVPSLVLLDLTLPDMPGSEVLNVIRSAPGCAQTRVVVVSGWDDLDRKAKELGADGSLRKPVDLKELKALVQRM